MRFVKRITAYLSQGHGSTLVWNPERPWKELVCYGDLMRGQMVSEARILLSESKAVGWLSIFTVLLDAMKIKENEPTALPCTLLLDQTVNTTKQQVIESEVGKAFGSTGTRTPQDGGPFYSCMLCRRCGGIGQGLALR